MNKNICPICGQDNNCRHGSENCWCIDVKIPKSLLERIPQDKKGKACICKTCIDRHKENQEGNYVSETY